MDKINIAKKTLGFALSGGGARGFAFPGILQAFEDSGIRPAAISAVSAGAIAGALYAAGENPREIHEAFQSIKVMSWKNLLFRGKTLMDQEKLSNWLGEMLKGKRFEDLEIPITIAATNLKTGEPAYFSSGSIVDKILASAAFPLGTDPVIINDEPYVDGGLLDNMPTAPLKQQCDFIIGINVNPLPEAGNLEKLKEISERIFQVLIYQNAIKNRPECDLWMEPEFLKGYSFFGFDKKEELYKKAYQTTQEWIGQNISRWAG